MNYTTSDEDKVAEYAGLLFTIAEIAILLGCNEDELKQEITDKSSRISIAYQNGKMQTILELRKQEIKLAKLGSTLSIEIIQKHLLAQQLSENE